MMEPVPTIPNMDERDYFERAQPNPDVTPIFARLLDQHRRRRASQDSPKPSRKASSER